jgi:hypothetical protein
MQIQTFFAVKRNCPIVFDQVEDQHILDVLKNAYEQQGYKVLILADFDEENPVVIELMERMHREQAAKNERMHYAVGMRFNNA